MCRILVGSRDTLLLSCILDLADVQESHVSLMLANIAKNASIFAFSQAVDHKNQSRLQCQDWLTVFLAPNSFNEDVAAQVYDDLLLSRRLRIACDIRSGNM